VLTGFASVRFFFRLYGFKGGIVFALNLIRHSGICIFAIDLTKNLVHTDDIINPNFDFRLINDATDFDSIEGDYVSVKGRYLALHDKQLVVSGKECLGVIYNQDQFAGWGWIKKGPFKLGNHELANNECMILKCRTVWSQRNRGVYMNLLLRMQQVLRKQGVQKVYIFSLSFNKTSLRCIEKVGFKFVEEYDRGSFASRLFRRIVGRGT